MSATNLNRPLLIGLMSGTSLDGVDGVLAAFDPDHGAPVETLATAHLPFSPSLRAELMALQTSGQDEIHRESQVSNALARIYADCVAQLLKKAAVAADDINAIGMHGQTIRHRPEVGYTRQTGNAALLAELTGIDVVADFRSRDIAAGGQGAPLVPAFHQAMFGNPDETRVVANIGGIANISILKHDGAVIGFDTGPGNVLMDAWIERHQAKPFDKDGAWAADGHVVPSLLQALRDEPYFIAPPPKSTGRDLFHLTWMDTKLIRFADVRPVDVQATLAALTASTLADTIADHAPCANAVYVCGGGAFNKHLMQRLASALQLRQHRATCHSTATLGVSPDHVEALAFGWLALRFLLRKPGNLQTVTGARGPRLLGALYPAL